MTTEFEILRSFAAAIRPHAHLQGFALQQKIQELGAVPVRQLQENHGHSLAYSVGLLRDVLTLEKENAKTV